jgi:FKBP-type peptidyl-prolyl cis-trans isomerase SlyD
MKIAQNTVVTLDYTLKVDGSLVESTDGDEPMTYLHGHENIVPGLEKALLGLVVGDTKRVLVQPKDGYGEYDEDGVQNLAKTNFEEALEVAGTYFGETEDGEPISFSVLEETETEYVVDFNHALAGETLEFEVTVRDIREATKSELEHGHVHGGDDHEHVN